MAKIVIFGAGGIAKLAHYYFTLDSDYEVAAFTVDQAYRRQDTFLDLPLVDFQAVASLYPPASYKMFIAVSYVRMNKVRMQKYSQAKGLGYELVSYVSSRCTSVTDYPMGNNCLVLEGTVIQPFVKIGNNVTLWGGSYVGHESVIEDHCFISTNVAVLGGVHIHPYCFIGANATLRDSITIAPETLVGAGAVIMEDTVEKAVYVPPRALLLDRKSDEMEI